MRDRPFDTWFEAHADFVAVVLVLLGLALRLKAAWGTFLNPDEALHFFIANRDSSTAAYRASLTMAHPPLFFFLLYCMRNVGTSEFVLRLPSIVAGTAFCWIFYRWLTEIFGRTVAFIALMFVALLPPLVDLSAEVRQYELLLLFLVSAAYLFETAIAKSSPTKMLFSAAFLYLGMLSHYSAFLFAAALGLYSLPRVFGHGTSLSLRLSWIAGQLGALGLAIFLYLTHISKIQGTRMAEGAFETWLYKSYFHRGHGNPLGFVVARSFSVFQYVFGQLAIGDVAALLFLTGIVCLLRGKIPLPKPSPSARQLATLLVLPFAVNCVAALLDKYPYGGTRHSVFLVMFATTGVALCLARFADNPLKRAVALAAALVLLCYAFQTVHHPYIARADQSRARIAQAVAFVQRQIPESEPIFVDYESGLVLGHYLCEPKPVSYDESIPGFLVFRCGGHRIVSTVHDLWFFTPRTFLTQWENLAHNGGLKSGVTVWVGQAGWNVTLDDDLRDEFPEFHDLHTQSFGRNIKFFKIAAGQPIPSVASLPGNATPQQH